MRLLTPLTAFVLLAGTLTAADPPKFDPKADLDRLRGVWQTDADAKVSVRMEFTTPGITLVAKPAGKDLTFKFAIEDAFELKQVDGATAIVMNETLAKLQDVPKSIGYRFDKEALVVTFADGGLKGEHRLTKQAKKEDKKDK